MSGTTTLELPRGARSAGIARLIVTAHGAGLPSERLKSANLMVSELVSNACRHGSGRIQLTVNSDEARHARGGLRRGHRRPDRPGRAPPRPRWLGPALRGSALRLVGRRQRRLTRLVRSHLGFLHAEGPQRRVRAAAPSRRTRRAARGLRGARSSRRPWTGGPARSPRASVHRAAPWLVAGSHRSGRRSRRRPRTTDATASWAPIVLVTRRAEVARRFPLARIAQRRRGGSAADTRRVRQRIERCGADRRELGAREVVQRERGQRAVGGPARRAPLRRDVRVGLGGDPAAVAEPDLGHGRVDDRVARPGNAAGAGRAGHAAGGDDHRAGRAGGGAAAIAVGQPSGLDRHVDAPADPSRAQVRDQLQVDLGHRRRDRRLARVRHRDRAGHAAGAGLRRGERGRRGVGVAVGWAVPRWGSRSGPA